MVSENIFNIYIDEAGDEGFKFTCTKGRGSSKFFVLSAIIVKQELDLNLARLVNELKIILKFQRKDMLAPLHFYKMSHEKRKACISKLYDFKDFKIISIVFQKENLQNSFKTSSALYNYACKVLITKASIFLKQNQAKANFVFEHRRNTHYNEIESYINKIIDYNRYVLSIKSLTKAQSKCLQLADIIASSTFQAFEPNQYDGDIEPSYLLKLKNNFYNNNGKCIGYGLKIFPSNTNMLMDNKYNWLNLLQISKNDL